MSVRSAPVVRMHGPDASTDDSPHDLSVPPPQPDESTVSVEDDDDMSDISCHHRHHDRLVIGDDDDDVDGNPIHTGATRATANDDSIMQDEEHHHIHRKRKRRVKTTKILKKKPVAIVQPKPSPYETAAIRPSGKNPYIQLSLIKADTKRRAMGAKATTSLQSRSRSQTTMTTANINDSNNGGLLSQHRHHQLRPSPTMTTTMPHPGTTTTTSTTTTTTTTVPGSTSRLPRLDSSRPNTTHQDKKTKQASSSSNTLCTTPNNNTNKSGVDGSVVASGPTTVLLAPLQKQQPTTTNATANPSSSSSSVKKLLRHFVSISRTLEEACRAVEAENSLGRQEIMEAEESRRRQIERLYAPIHNRLLIADQLHLNNNNITFSSSTTAGVGIVVDINEGMSRSPTVAMLHPPTAEVLGQLSSHHQTITIEGLSHELVMVQLEEEDDRNTWVKRLWSDLKAIHRACRRLAAKIEQDCNTAKAELAKAQCAEQEEREFNYRQNEAERNEYYSRQIRQLYLDESKLRFAVEMEEYRATTILRYTEREHSTRALANSLKKMELQRAEERTTFVFGLFQDSFTDMERERIEELYAIRNQYAEQGTALVLKYQAKARGEIEGKEATVRKLRQTTLCTHELRQLYMRSVEGREVIVRKTLLEEQEVVRGPLEERVGQYMEDVRSSLGTAEDLVKDMISRLLQDESGELAAIDLRCAREDMVVRYVKEAVANGERAARIAERLQSPPSTANRTLRPTSTSSGYGDDGRRPSTHDFKSVENVFGSPAVKKLLGDARAEAAQGVVAEAIESACTALALEYEHQHNQKQQEEEEDAAKDVDNASSSSTLTDADNSSIAHTSSSSASSASDFTI